MTNEELFEAAQTGKLDGVTAEQLACAVGEDGWTALHSAAAWGHLDKVAVGVTVEQLTAVWEHGGWTALHIAVPWGHLDQVKPETKG